MSLDRGEGIWRKPPHVAVTRFNKAAQKGRQQRIRNLRRNIRDWTKQIEESRANFTQCAHLIHLFGGIIPFSVAVGVHPTEIIKYWLAPVRSPSPSYQAKTHGRVSSTRTGGLVPAFYLPLIINAARSFGIVISPEDLYPDFNIMYSEPTKEKVIQLWAKNLRKSIKQAELEDLLASLE